MPLTFFHDAPYKRYLPMISILAPSRGRPEKCFANIQKWFGFRSRTIDVEIIVSLDDNDIKLHRYEQLYNTTHARLIVNENRSAVDAINNAAKQARYDIFIVVSDDTDCQDNWDRMIRNATYDKEDWILKTQDGIQPWIITMPILDRAYYNRSGYIYYPEYKHLYADTELTCVADITGRKITSNLLFPHNHYSIGKSTKDAVSVRADSTEEQGRKLFLDRYSRNFDLPKMNQIKEMSMINWLIKQGQKYD